jgi:hypothetical protein
MARPVKNNADYFSHDADMRNHRKMKAIRAKFGLEGYAVWNMLLEVLTDAEHFEIEIDEVEVELLAGDFGIESDLLSEMVAYFSRLKLIQTENGTTTCKSLVERMQPLIDKRQRQKSYAKKKKTSKNDNSRVNDVENSVNDVENTQSKVKYSKVKESIVKESKDFLQQKKNEKSPDDIEKNLRQFFNENEHIKRKLFLDVEKSCGRTLTVSEKKAIAQRITIFANDYVLRPSWNPSEPVETKVIRFTNYIINSIKNGYELTNNNSGQAANSNKKGFRVSKEFEGLLDEIESNKQDRYGYMENDPFARGSKLYLARPNN